MNPIGPEEPSTYWRRRAIVVVGLLAAIWLVWWLLGTAFGGSGEQAADGPGQSTGVGWSISVAESPGGAVSPMPSNDAVSGSPAPSASASGRTVMSTVLDHSPGRRSPMFYVTSNSPAVSSSVPAVRADA